MKLVSITLARNEADIVEAFVRYHAAFVDRMVVLDQASTDGTTEILAELEREGLPLSTRSAESLVFEQSRLMTGLMHEAARDDDPGFVLPLDVDELLVSASGRPIREVIESLDSTAPSEVFWRTYIPLPEDDRLDPNPITRIRHRKAREERPKAKVIVPRAVANAPGSYLAAGSHRVKTRPSGERVAPSPTDDIVLAHFPLRSPEQVVTKLVSGFAGRVAHDRLHRNLRPIADLLRIGRPIQVEDVKELALGYALLPEDEPSPDLVYDPVPHAPAVRLCPGRPLDPLSLLLESTEQVIDELRLRLAGMTAR